MVHFNTKPTKSKLGYLKCVTYAQPIPLSLMQTSFKGSCTHFAMCMFHSQLIDLDS